MTVPGERSIPLDLSGSTALVTGASRGIGHAIARTLLERGAKVAMTSTHHAPSWINEWPGAVHYRLDFEDDASVDGFLADFAKPGDIDILINNAGVHQLEAIDEVSRKAWNRLFRVNLYGPTVLTRHFAAHMKANRRGRIVNVASIAGTVCKPNASVYSSSNLGLMGLTRSSATDL
ncbi:MAG: SDR family oxidoreductase, partial [Chloroflexota bacterium]